MNTNFMIFKNLRIKKIKNKKIFLENYTVLIFNKLEKLYRYLNI